MPDEFSKLWRGSEFSVLGGTGILVFAVFKSIRCQGAKESKFTPEFSNLGAKPSGYL